MAVRLSRPFSAPGGGIPAQLERDHRRRARWPDAGSDTHPRYEAHSGPSWGRHEAFPLRGEASLCPMEQDQPPEQPWGLLARRRDSPRPRRKVHSRPSWGRQGTPAPGEGIPARMEQDQPTGAAVGKIFHAGGRAVIRARSQNFPDLGEGDAQLSRAVRMWPAYARTPLRPSIPAGWPFISTHFRYVFGLFCNLFLGMTKPPQRTCASRQRADTRFSPLSWTHPIRAETRFLPF